MTREFERGARLGEHIRRLLADLIRRELNDPRIGLLSITSVQVGRDLSRAKVYYSFLGSEDEATALNAVLNGAAGRLRAGLSRALTARTVPALDFVYDDSLARGARMDELIAEARARDESSRGGGGGDE